MASGRPHPARNRILQNYLLVWIDPNVDESNSDCQHTLQQLRTVVNDVSVFTEPDACVAFLQSVNQEKAFVITSGGLGQNLVPCIHTMAQVHTIYIFCGNRALHTSWATKWSKIKDVYTRIEPICEALQQSAQQCNQDLTPMSFVLPSRGDSATKLNELEPSFMYTQLFKNALLDMKHESQALEHLVKYCQEQIADPMQLKVIDEFRRDYRPKEAIWWYTRDSFIYQMLNRALRLLEADIIVNMGFFVHDLHRQIEQLHRQQIIQYNGQIFKLYRGQGLSTADFNKLRRSQGGLLSFNSFVSTSTERAVSLDFATKASRNDDTVGILFVMNIDPAVDSTPFADIGQFSYFEKQEAEILFSMHSVFRVDRVQGSDKQGRVWEVRMTLTADDDPQLRMLTDRMNEEVENCKGWERIGRLLISVGQLNKAEELYMILLAQASKETDRANYNHQLGSVKKDQGDYKKALSHYEKALDMRQKTLPANHPDLATSYNNIGLVYSKMGEYSKALSHYEKALDMRQKTLPANHPDLATSYNNIGLVYSDMGEYSKALSYYEKALDIYQKTLPANHPDLATSYNNIGFVYSKMGEYSKALSHYEKALDICQKTLPANHPSLATSYNNIGLVYSKMGEYSKALSYYEKALDIYQKTLPANHPDLATSYNNIGLVYSKMGEYSKALSHYEKALDMRQKTLPANHPSLAPSYNNIGSVYSKMGEYSKALSHYEKALDIDQKTLPANHPDLATSYNNIGSVYSDMGEYSKALSHYEKCLDIRQHSLPSNDPRVKLVSQAISSLKKKL